MASGLFAADGSVIPNIRTQNYRVTFVPAYIHTKIKAAQIVIAAEDLESARSYAAHWLKLPMMVIENVEAA